MRRENRIHFEWMNERMLSEMVKGDAERERRMERAKELVMHPEPIKNLFCIEMIVCIFMCIIVKTLMNKMEWTNWRIAIGMMRGKQNY